MCDMMVDVQWPLVSRGGSLGRPHVKAHVMMSPKVMRQARLLPLTSILFKNYRRPTCRSLNMAKPKSLADCINTTMSQPSAKTSDMATPKLAAESSNTPAAAAVFGTYELLESILVLVPAHLIHQLKCVSKTWSQVITSSARVRKARCLSPAEWIKNHHVHGRPLYKPKWSVRIHPHFRAMCLRSGNGHSLYAYWYYYFRVPEKEYKSLERWGADYATIPPIQAVEITVEENTIDSSRIMFVKEGVKVRDILEAGKALVTTHEKYVTGLEPEAHKSHFVVGFEQNRTFG